MKFMFANSHNLTYINISNFDTSQVTNYQAMFLGLKNIRDLYLTSFDFSNGLNFTQIFDECENLSIWIRENTYNNKNFIKAIPLDVNVHNVSIGAYE